MCGCLIQLRGSLARVRKPHLTFHSRSFCRILGREWDRTLMLNVMEVTPGEIPFYQRRLMLATLGLWAAGLVALMIRVRVAKAV